MRSERVDARRFAGPGPVVAELRALVPGTGSVEEAVRDILRRVRHEGDHAVLEYTRAWDTAGATPRPLEVAAGELRGTFEMLGPDVREGLDAAYAAVFEVAAAVVDDEARELHPPGGARIVLREVPVASAAIYVPGGRAPYPSTVVMGVAAARAAGVRDVRVVSPPGPDGDVHPVVRGACERCGDVRLFRMGGAQAVAACAYGTASVPRAEVIAGPGSLYVAEAKRQVFGAAGIDSLAGPSDLMIVLGDGADLEWAGLDLLAQAEHGPATLVVAVAADRELLDGLHEQVAGAGAQATLALVDVGDLEAAAALADAFAPEHLQLMGAGAEALAPRLAHAGCIFVGNASATAFGDYVAGSNHVLPTGGAARYASALNPQHFRRRVAEVHVGDAAGALARLGAPIARAEGFEVHAQSMEARIRQTGHR